MYLTIYEEAVSHMTLHPIPLNFLSYEDDFILFFISAHLFRPIGLSFDYPKDWLRPSIVVTEWEARVSVWVSRLDNR